MGLPATPSAPEGADIVMVKPGLPFLDIILPGEGALRRAYIRLSGFGRICDAHGGGGQGFSTATKPCSKPIAFKRAGADAILMFCAPRGKEADGNGVRRLRRLVKPR
jgi:delta-aminolevulinic acid dehydratase/porphobilinogen synthase